MKNKGFTLVELLAVIILLGVIATITTVSVNKLLKDNKEKLFQIQVNNIREGAKSWASDNIFELPEEEGMTVVKTLNELKNLGYVDKKITNPKTKKPFSDEIIVEIKRVGNSYEYNVKGV